MCDGVGGSIKVTVTWVNMQRPYKDQICTPYEMFALCDQQFSKVTFQFVKTKNINEIEPLALRYVDHKTIRGTRSHNLFQTSVSNTNSSKTNK